MPAWVLAGAIACLFGAGLLSAEAARGATNPGITAPRLTEHQLENAVLGDPEPPSRGLLDSGLFDSSRLTLRHSLSYGVVSGSAGSRSGGLWLTEADYRLADPLHLSVDVGMALDPSGGQMLNSKNIYLQGLNLDYTPSKNFRVQLSYRHAPPGGARPYGSLYGYSPVSPWRTGPTRP